MIMKFVLEVERGHWVLVSAVFLFQIKTQIAPGEDQIIGEIGNILQVLGLDFT